MARQIERIIILALHGQAREITTIDDAIRFVEGYADDGRGKPIERDEIEVRYNNGDMVRGQFKDKAGRVSPRSPTSAPCLILANGFASSITDDESELAFCKLGHRPRVG